MSLLDQLREELNEEHNKDKDPGWCGCAFFAAIILIMMALQHFTDGAWIDWMTRF